MHECKMNFNLMRVRRTVRDVSVWLLPTRLDAIHHTMHHFSHTHILNLFKWGASHLTHLP